VSVLLSYIFCLTEHFIVISCVCLLFCCTINRTKLCIFNRNEFVTDVDPRSSVLAAPRAMQCMGWVSFSPLNYKQNNSIFIVQCFSHDQPDAGPKRHPIHGYGISQ